MALNQTLIPKEELELFRELPDIQVVFDVGARVDTDYIDIHPNIELHAFEPNPEFFEWLKEKIGDKPNAHLNNVGVGDIIETRPYDPATQSFMLNVSNDALPIITLDHYLKDHPEIERIDFLKIDVEGIDHRVIVGAPRAVSMTRFLQYEYWDRPELYPPLLKHDFDMENVGYRNVLCMNKKLVPLKERNRLKRLIKKRGYASLV